MEPLVVVDSLKDWPFSSENIRLITAQEYLGNPLYHKRGGLKLLNLCRSYAYQKLGYYVSLVAMARGHKCQPNLICIEDLKSDSMIRLISREMDELIQKSLKRLESDTFVLSIYFGHSLAKCHEKLAAYLCQQFPAPFLKARFSKVKDKWIMVNIYPASLRKIPEEHLEFAQKKAENYFRSGATLKKAPVKNYRYDLAILIDPKNANPPSNPAAIQHFVRAAEEQGFSTQIITSADFGRLAEFDALFIRETTAVNHYTFRFARAAAAQGIAVIDDPNSILTCTNKIFLAELFQKHSLPMPPTQILSDDLLKNPEYLPATPFVLKRPDGCFSNGVILVQTPKDFLRRAPEFFKSSDLLIAQRFMPSEYDWRIGVLGGKLLFACKYYMVKDHWQIVQAHKGEAKVREGEVEAVPLSKVPQKARQIAIKAANLIGDGLYGIDLKEIDGQFYIIEVNDNPNIDAGSEDEILGDRLYADIIHHFKERVEALGRND